MHCQWQSQQHGKGFTNSIYDGIDNSIANGLVNTWLSNRHENSRRHGRHAWGTNLMELRNHMSLLLHNCPFCLSFVWLDLRLRIWGCLHDVSLCILPQFEAAIMILPHWCNLKGKSISKRPIFMRHFEEPKINPKSCLRNRQAQFSCLQDWPIWLMS